MRHESQDVIIPPWLLRRIPDAKDVIADNELFCMRLERAADTHVSMR